MGRARILLLFVAVVVGVTVSSADAAVISVIGDCEKIESTAPIPSCPYIWDAGSRTIKLYAAKNEVVAFQIAIQSSDELSGCDVWFSDLKGPSTIPAKNLTAFLEHYVKVTRGIKAPGELPIGLEYPDPLVPLYDPYASPTAAAPVAAPFKVTPDRNTLVWVDCWIPPDAAAGSYNGTLIVSLGGREVPLKTDLTVWDFPIPSESHIFNNTELYRWQFEYHEKAKWGFGASGWEKMKRYDELLLQHRMQNCLTRLWPPIEFAADGKVKSIDWTEYDKYAGARLDGSFVEDGPTKGARASMWFFQFSPIWPNNPDLSGPYLDYRKRGPYEENVLRTLAHAVAAHWKERGWTTPIIVGVLDESSDWETIQWAARIFHEEGGGLFLYMNTGHYGVKPQLVGSVDIWAPNAEFYDPCEMAPRIAAGEMSWFYHWHEPQIGHMTVNTGGVAMRTWDAAAFKYGVDGTFLWCANNWPHPNNWRKQWGPLPSPYIDPAGQNGGERFGNGTYVYAGAELTDVGLKPVDGPVPSMRLKTMRRGAQDFEYLWILKERGRIADARGRGILSKVIRSALRASSQLGDKPAFAIDPALPWTKDIAPGEGDWSHNAADWEQMRMEAAREILSGAQAGVDRH